MHHHVRFLFGALSLSILAGASGCDKHDVEQSPQTSLAGKPRMLFLVFGERADARALPIATLADNHIAPISLDSMGWRNFDQLYFKSGSELSTYSGGKAAGVATISRGMWDQKTPLYKLPSCRALRPLAAVQLKRAAAAPVMTELLATSDPLLAPPPRSDAGPTDHDSAVAFGPRAAEREGLTAAARAQLDEMITVVATGANRAPTIIASYTEPGSNPSGNVRQYFVIGDRADTAAAYGTSYVHAPRDSVPEFRRYIDHMDLTGDGVDEIILEGWQPKSDSYLIFLQYTAGHWREIPVGSSSWCVSSARK